MNLPAPDGFNALNTGVVAANAVTPQPPSPETLARLQAYHVQEAKQNSIRKWQRIERMILLPILLAVFVGLFNFKMGQVQGRSMAPTYETGDKLLLLKSYKTFSPVKVGDIVVIKLSDGKYKGEEWVKRVVFVQNDKGTAKWQPEIRTSKRVSLEAWFPDYFAGERQVPANHIMVMGDNFMNSVDSRDEEIGAIAPSEVEGKVIKVWISENNSQQAAM
ncbi:MAG: signal peptidase I [Akkermansiaceae bacterium]|nr:signal peptidase I [Armatimonadota bacterium]